MELSKKLLEALNKQVTMEYEAAYIYNGMRLYLQSANIHGGTRWMTKQVHEELKHAQDFADFILDVDGELADLGKQNAVATSYKSMLEVWETGLEHEKKITESITKALEIAIADKHYAAENFLRTYIDEQVEEEDNFRSICDLLRMAGDDRAALLRVDEILGRRGN